MSKIVIHNHYTRTRDAAPKWEIEFDKKRGRHKIPSEADQHVEAVAKRLGLWKGGNDPFPSFTLYKDGEEAGGG